MEIWEKNIVGILDGLEKSGVDILELGFLRDEKKTEDRTIFTSVEDIKFLLNKKKNIIYSAMIEAFDPFPIEKLSLNDNSQIDLIRICIWKRCINEHMQYCKAIADKGYKISIQPSRVEQYSDEEFIDMIKRSNELRPFSVYVVDTWGTQSSKQIVHYLELADKYLDDDIKIGYHGHNNKLQALSCAQAAVEMNLKHELCIDSSIMGMGRGAGNLNTEIIMNYLNEIYESPYRDDMIVNIFNNYLRDIYAKTPWGYSIYYYLTSIYNTNPNFAAYFQDKGYSENLMKCFLQSLSEEEKIVFSSKFVEERLDLIRETKIVLK